MSNSNTPNKFSGGCKVNPKSSTQRKGLDDLTYVKDIHWYPEKKTMVIEKSNRTNLVVDLSTIVGTAKTTAPINIAVWDPSTSPTNPSFNDRVLIAEDTEFTKAIQFVVNELSFNDKSESLQNVIRVVKAVTPTIDVQTKKDIELMVFHPDTGETETDVVVAQGTEITVALQSIVDLDNTVKGDVNIFVFHPAVQGAGTQEAPEIPAYEENKKVVQGATPLTVALNQIANNDPTVKESIKIKVWDPVQQQGVPGPTIVEANTEITTALQTIVEKLRSWDAWD